MNARFRPRLGAMLPLSAAVLLGALTVSGIPADAAGVGTALPPDFRRLSESQYRATIADAFGPDIKVSGRFEPEMRVQGMLAAGSRSAGLTTTALGNYDAIARAVAAQVVDEQHRQRLVGCAPAPADPQGRACATAFFDKVGLSLYRRPLQKEERDVFVVAALDAGRQLDDFAAGLSASLAGMLVDLPVIFQRETYVRDPSQPGRMTLDAWSRASRLSYMLWNAPPDDRLLEAARSGALMNQAGLTAEVDRMIASPRFMDNGRAFFDDFLQLDGFAALSKDGSLYPAFRATVPPAAREQTLRTAVQLLYAEQGDYRDLFTTRRVAMNRTLSPLYRLPFAGRDWDMVTLPSDDPHVGIISQVGFQALHSHPGRTSPTLRGKAIREILLCEEISPPPANVNFAIVQDTSNPQFKTTRERLSAHLDDEECASCHRRTDGIGLSFERFDGAGQYRAAENGAPIDTSGLFDKVPVADPVELGRAIGNSPKAARCLVRSAFRFAAGRPTAAGDDMFLGRLDTAFAKSGYRIGALFRAIALDPAFYTRDRLATPAAPRGPAPAIARSR